MRSSAKQQTIFITAVNALVRALGLFLRVILSRMLGAEIMGVAELAQSVHMIAIAPLTSGLPVAVSRVTAKAAGAEKQRPLEAGISLVRRASLVLIPILLILSPFLARWMGDPRVLPSIWFSAPCILILGYSAVYNGYCYGVGKSHIPALSELIEQVSRLLICLMLLYALPRLTAPWAAAVPVFSTMAAELLGLGFALCVLRLPLTDAKASRAWRAPVFRLAAPTTLARLLNTVFRSLSAILIPLRLQASGLSVGESTARLGMLNGMVTPILMLPCIFTAALSMVMLPKIALAEENPRALKRILLQCLYASLPVAALSWALIYLSAPLLANRVYRLAELAELFRLAAPLAFLHALAHISSGMIVGLGLQKRSLYGALPVSAATLLLTWRLAANPSMRLNGVVLAQEIGQIANILWSAVVLVWWRYERRR